MTRSLERVCELLRQQRAAVLGWRVAEVETLGAAIEDARRELEEDLLQASDAERDQLVPLLQHAQALHRSNRGMISQALDMVRQWRRILCGSETVSYDRIGRPVEAQRAIASGRIV